MAQDRLELRPLGRSAPTFEPFGRVLSLGDRAVRVGAAFGLALAAATHGAASAMALTALYDMLHYVDAVRAAFHEDYWRHYDIDVAPKPAAEAPEPEPEPEPEPPPPAPAAAAPAEAPPPDDPYDSPPPAPAPAQAAKVLTQEPPPDDEIYDQTDMGIVSGDGTGPTYGMVSAAGTATAPTRNPNAKAGGAPNGKGTGAPKGPPGPAAAGPDRSRAPGLVGGTSWNCPFPPEADAEQIDQAVAVIVVTVRPDGTPQGVKVVSDPGYGFGRAARMCALSRRYTTGLGRDGRAVTATTPPIKVRFSR